MPINLIQHSDKRGGKVHKVAFYPSETICGRMMVESGRPYKTWQGEPEEVTRKTCRMIKP